MTITDMKAKRKKSGKRAKTAYAVVYKDDTDWSKDFGTDEVFASRGDAIAAAVELVEFRRENIRWRANHTPEEIADIIGAGGYYWLRPIMANDCESISVGVREVVYHANKAKKGDK